MGEANGLEKVIDTVLNRAPLSASTNRHWIADKLPNSYLPKLIANSGESRVRANLETHFISPRAFDILLRDPFRRGDFEEFVAERKPTVIEAIEHLLVKERLDLSPTLRELDAKMEGIELRLRQLVSTRSEVHGLAIPEHVAAKVRERMQRDRRKGLLSSEVNDTLRQQMQYFDLRELEALIVARSMWTGFEDVFFAKEQLATRFSQLAELRNGIRHSRSVSQIVQKDGEAALLWFDARLSSAPC